MKNKFIHTYIHVYMYVCVSENYELYVNFGECLIICIKPWFCDSVSIVFYKNTIYKNRLIIEIKLLNMNCYV